MKATFLLFAARLALQAAAKTARSPTPPMGWNSYNTWSCSPSEDKIKESAQGLIALGLDKVGYNFVTVDCGWPSHDRDADGRLQWNATLFPSGGKALGDFLHGLGLDFGLYSGAGFLQCGSTDLPASLGFEQLDAESFAEWGGDSLKYEHPWYFNSGNIGSPCTGMIIAILRRTRLWLTQTLPNRSHQHASSTWQPN
jgi:hypothetical protein